METLEFRRAIATALDEELSRDPSVVFFGEDVAKPGGVFAATVGLVDKYPDRVFDTAITELAISGAGFGSAVTGLRPVFEIMFGDFLILAMDALINQSTKYWYVSGEQQSVPLTIRSIVGGGASFGPIHSQMPISWLMGVPGLKIVAASNPNDAAGLIKAAVRDNNPVLVLEHKRLYSMKAPRTSIEPTPIGRAKVMRQGTDVTVATAMQNVHDALVAAERLETRGISVEAIDLRTIRPIDWETISESVHKTNRLCVVEEGPITGGWAGEVVAQAAEQSLEDLDDVWRHATPDSPVPYSPVLESAFLPSADSIEASILGRLT